jgi:hypothetical protein
MVAVLVVLAMTALWLRTLHWLYHRGTAHHAGQATKPSAVPDIDVAAALPVQPGPQRDVAACLGVSSKAYERYVDRGLEDLDIFLADQPAA